MPTIGGSANYNPAGLIAMTPVQNWGQRRADNDRNLYYQSLLTQQAEQDKLTLQQQRQAVVDKYEKIRALPFLPQDQQRMNYLVTQVEDQVQNKIKKDYGGDLKRYLNEAADTDIQKFHANLQSSDTFRNATQNKIQISQYIEDQKQGKIPMLVGGRRFEDVLSDFELGKTGVIAYNGGYKPAKDFLKRVQDSYGDDRFKKQQASRDKIMQEMLTDGLTLQQAQDQYQQQGFDNIPIFHKYDDKYKYAEFMLDQTLKQARIAKLGEDSQSQKDSYVDIFGVYADPANYGAPVAGSFNGQAANIYRTNNGVFNNLDADGFMTALGAQLDKKSGTYMVNSDLAFFGNNGDPTKAIKGVSGFKPTGTKLVQTANGKQLFLVGDAVVGERGAKAAGIEGTFFSNSDFNGSAVTNDNTKWSLGLGNPLSENTIYTVKDVLIPVSNLSVADKVAGNQKRKIRSSIFNANYDNVASPAYEE